MIPLNFIIAILSLICLDLTSCKERIVSNSTEIGRNDSVPKVEVTSGAFTLFYDSSIGEEEKWYINDHCIIKDNEDKWHLFGITHAEPSNPLDEKNFAHAVGGELLQRMWSKQPFPLTADLESYGEYHLWAPHVVYHNGFYYMYYCAGGSSSDKYQINIAISKDLRNWKRYENNPIIVDGYDARDPMILKNDNEWIMYYTATSASLGGNHIVVAVTSSDLVNWGNRTVVYTDQLYGTYGGPTESPFVIYEGNNYFLFIGPYPEYIGTRVFMSNDPFNFEDAPQVGYIPSHAAEIIQNDDGTYYITHCGWGQGGVYIAPLFFKNVETPVGAENTK